MVAAGAGRRAGGTQLKPTLSLDALGAGLAAAYDGLVAEAVPERLSALLRQLEWREAETSLERNGEPAPSSGTASAGMTSSGTTSSGIPAGRFALLVGDVPGATEAAALLARAGLETIRCIDPQAGLDALRRDGNEVALVLIGLPTERDGALDGAGLARAVATLWPTIHLVVAQPPRPEARVPDAQLPPQAVPLHRAPDLLALAEQAARTPRPPVA
ncbi:NepR family anti-sigma factor [Methylobacterium tarhaniae]|uniref:NepR family anti-sigma factor n=1 Tax=Methylobacterium tarhaniae TaxID=1187852 RepID=UPI00069D938B|nr:NepR family anti-sigma factor [Methylobacterium tarhaniae]